MKKLLFLSMISAMLVSCGIKTPETSRLFDKYVDPETGVVSYILKPGILECNQQSVYFVNKSMSNDGRFIIFTIAGDQDVEGSLPKQYALVDLKKETVTNIELPFLSIEGGMIGSDIPDGKFYYLQDKAVYYRDLYRDPNKPLKVCDLPANYLDEGKEVLDYCCHLTLNHDRTRIFLDSRIDDKFILGSLDLRTGEWTKWWENDYVVNHCQYNPVRDDIVLGAYETGFTDLNGVEHTIQYEDGIYPRLQLFREGEKEMVPPMTNYATHERWNEQGDGFCWCTDFGVDYCDLETREQSQISPIGVHAMMSIDRRYVVSDERVGYFYRGTPWKVFFWDRELERGIYICSIMHGVATPDKPSALHPDPHPQFVKNDEYIIYSMMGEDRRINLAITPVKPLKERLEKKWIGDLPEDCDPRLVAQRISEQFLTTDPELYNPKGYGDGYQYGHGEYVHYSEVSLWVNALQIAHKLGQNDLENRLTDAFLPFMDEKADKQSIDSHVDYSIFGALPIEIYLTRAEPIRDMLRKNDDSILKLGMHYVENQWDKVLVEGEAGDNGNPTIEESRKYFDEGYSPQTRLWIDDMYMINCLQTQAYRATGKSRYIERAAREMVFYLEKLQREDGLFEHSSQSSFIWGRGDGWMAAGMPMILRYLDKDNEYYDDILAGYLKMMETLLKWQRDNGLWGQLVNDEESWDESSCSAMFAYAMLEGVKQGWLPEETYAPAVRKAWLALCGLLDENANLADVCMGTAAINERDWYLNRPKYNGDPHGQAPMLWLCNALL